MYILRLLKYCSELSNVLWLTFSYSDFLLLRNLIIFIFWVCWFVCLVFPQYSSRTIHKGFLSVVRHIRDCISQDGSGCAKVRNSLKSSLVLCGATQVPLALPLNHLHASFWTQLFWLLFSLLIWDLSSSLLHHLGDCPHFLILESPIF